METSKKKNNTIELIRIFAIWGVVCIHTAPYGNRNIFSENWHTFGQILLTLAHCAVPFFLITAGYFFAQKFEEQKDSISYWTKYTKRLLFLYIAWTIIYLLYNDSWLETLIINGDIKAYYWNTIAFANDLFEKPLSFLLRGSAIPLWFLFSLIYSITLLVVFRKLIKNQKIFLYLMFFFATLSYAVGLFFGAYGGTNIGSTTRLNIEELGPLLAPLFVITGYSIKVHGDAFKKYWPLLVTLGLIMIFFESYISSYLKEVDYRATSYTVGTFLFSSGLFLLAVSYPNSVTSRIVTMLGSLTLGVYLTHFLIFRAALPVRHVSQNPLWELLFPTFIMCSSIMLTMILKKVKPLKKLVS